MADVRRGVRADVGSVLDFADRTLTVVEAVGRQIGIVRWDDRFYALSNVCPHMGGPACGGLIPKIVSPGQVTGRLDVEPVPVVICSWHSWEFDARNGSSLTPGSLRLRTYATDVVEGRVLVDVRRTADEVSGVS